MEQKRVRLVKIDMVEVTFVQMYYELLNSQALSGKYDSFVLTIAIREIIKIKNLE